MMIRNIKNKDKINESINIKRGTNDSAHNSGMFIHDVIKSIPTKPTSGPHVDRIAEGKSHVLAGAMVGIAFVSLVVQFATFVRSGKTVNNVITESS